MTLDVKSLSGSDLTAFVAALRRADVVRAAKLSRSTTQTAPNNTTTVQTFNTLAQSSDIATPLWTVGDPTKLVIPSELNGRYGMLASDTEWDASFGHRDHWLDQNATNYVTGFQSRDPGATYEDWNMFVSHPFLLTTGDYYRSLVYQSTAATRTLQFTNLTLFVL